MTQQEIQELAGHRQVPAWVVKLVGDCLAKEREQEPVAWAKDLSLELLGVIIDVEEGDGFDEVCLNTIKRVCSQLATHPQPKGKA